MADQNDNLTIGEFERTIERVEANQVERISDLKNTVTEGFRRLESKYEENRKRIHSHANAIASHETRLALLEATRAPHVAQLVAGPVEAKRDEDGGVIKIWASKNTWATLAAIVGVVQTFLLVLFKKLGWLQ